MNEYQSCTSLPNCNQKHIDYVIRYTLDLDDNSIDKKNVLKKIYVKLFLDELKKENIEVFTLEAKSIHMKHVFVMLHCPMERLLVEAEKTKLEMQLKNDDSITLKHETESPFLKKFKNIKCFKPDKDDSTITFASNISTSYDRMYRNLFFGIDEKQTVSWLFSTPTRCLLVNNIICKIQLKNQFIQANGSIKSLEESNESQLNYQLSKGIQFMLGENYFEEMFILHDETKHQILLLQLMEHSEILFKDSEDINKVAIGKNFKLIDQDLRDRRAELFNKWASLRNIFKFQPVNMIRDYFGEEIAYYFVFSGVIITTLWIPTFIGIAFFFAGLSISSSQSAVIISNSTSSSPYMNRFASSFDNVLTPCYSIIMCLWGPFFLEYLKRQCYSLAYDWNVVNYIRKEPKLPGYVMRKAKYKKRLESNESVYVEYFLAKEKQLRLFGTYLVLFLMIMVVALEVAIVAVFRVFIKTNVFPTNQVGQLLIGDVGSTLLNAIFVATLNWSYDVIAHVSTKWETHRTRTEFNNSLILKTFAFQFVNNYASLIYMAFFRNIKYTNGMFGLGSQYQDTCDGSNCMSLLSLQVFVSIIIKPIPTIFSTIAYPMMYMIKKRMDSKKNNRKTISITETEVDITANKNRLYQKHVYLYLFNEHTKPDTDDLIMNQYKSKVILFGYMMMFACSFYLTPFIFLILCLIDIRMNAQSLLWLFRRSIAFKAQDIGIWFSLCRFINVAGIIINGLIIAYTSTWSERVLINSTQRLIFFVSFEHALFIIWYFIHAIIFPDLSKKTTLKIKQEEYFVDTVLEKAKQENEKEKEKKNNLIEELLKKEALKKSVKIELDNIEKDPFAKSHKIEKESEPESSTQLETGVQTYPSGDRYEGELLNEKKHGKGIIYFKNGAKYGGDWYDDEMTGKGTYWYYNGDCYTGDMLKGLKHGEGTYVHRNGEKYIGTFENDRKHGKGTFYFLSGDMYEGDYVNGVKQGKGTYYYRNGEKYTGDVNDNKKTGQGTYWYTNGDIYEGGFYNGKLDGKGILYCNKLDRSHTGFWSNGVEVKKGKRDFNTSMVKEISILNKESDLVENSKEIKV